MAGMTGKTAIVTGAGSGIGAATARRLDRDGANVVLVGRTREKLDAVAADLDGARTLVVAADVAKREDVDRVVAETRARFGGIDVLVNNAGVVEPGRLDDYDEGDWDKTIAVDLTGVFLCSKAAIADLRKARGSIVNVSSVSGLGGDWGMFAYNAAKGGVSNMTRALALDLAPEVRVNAVAPSLTVSEMTTGVRDDEGMLAKFRERIPMGRPAEAEEVADVIAFLASHDARFVNGVVLPVDGGLGASNGQPPLG
ncbi:MAG: SDR family NAD(P)-dependent oxidoreductase [Paracoccaceae bacterium]